MNPNPTLYHYHPETGELTGTSTAEPSPLEPGVWLIPASATTEAPPLPMPGKTRHRVGKAWEYRDIPPPPPPPPGLAKPSPAEIRRAEITARLAQIDAASVGALRVATLEQLRGKPVLQAEKTKLADLEAEAERLRAELAALK